MYVISTHQHDLNISHTKPINPNNFGLLVFIDVDENLNIKYIKGTFYTDNKNVDCIYENLNLCDSLSPEITGSNLEQKLRNIYQNLLLHNHKIIDNFKNYLGVDDFQKVCNYFIAVVGYLLCSFYFLKNFSSDTENSDDSPLNNDMYPLNLCFPTSNVSINLLNNKFYNYLSYYIDTFKTMDSQLNYNDNISDDNDNDNSFNFVKSWLIIYKNFWSIFGFTFKEASDDQIFDDLNSIHASNLGFGKYIEARSLDFVNWIKQEKINFKELIKKQEIEATTYHNNEVIKIAEKLNYLNTRISELSLDLDNISKRAQESMILLTENAQITHKNNLDTAVKELIDQSRIDISKILTSASEKVERNSQDIVISISSDYNTKIRNNIDDILDKKSGVISEINKIKLETFNQLLELSKKTQNDIESATNIAKKELLDIKAEIIKISGHESMLTSDNIMKIADDLSVVIDEQVKLSISKNLSISSPISGLSQGPGLSSSQGLSPGPCQGLSPGPGTRNQNVGSHKKSNIANKK